MPWVAILALWGLFLPFLGPIADHHFVERLPGHQHIYLSGSKIGHTHPYHSSHAHDNSDTTEDIIFLPPNEKGIATTASIILMAVILPTLAAVVVPPALTKIVLRLPQVLRGLSPPPEPLPPRPAL